jgi:hypothetical protein
LPEPAIKKALRAATTWGRLAEEKVKAISKGQDVRIDEQKLKKLHRPVHVQGIVPRVVGHRHPIIPLALGHPRPRPAVEDVDVLAGRTGHPVAVDLVIARSERLVTGVAAVGQVAIFVHL